MKFVKVAHILSPLVALVTITALGTEPAVAESGPGPVRPAYTKNCPDFGGKPIYCEWALPSISPANAPGRGVIGCVSVRYLNRVSGKGCFQPHGDRVYVRDTRADGHHVEVRITQPTAGFLCHTIGSSRAGWESCTGFASRMREHMYVHFAVCVYEGTTQLRCKTKVTRTSW